MRGRMLAPTAGVAAALAMLSSALPARAQSAQDAAAAEALFSQAKQLMRDKRYAEACPKLAESNRLDVGIGSLLWLADCYEKNGQVASSWATFLEAADLANKEHDEREKVARERAASLETSLPKVTLRVDRANQDSGVEIKRDGVVVGQAIWDTEVPIYPGEHTLDAAAPGRKPFHLTFTVAPGKAVKVVIVPALEASGSAGEVAEPSRGPTEEAAPAAASSSGPFDSGQKIGGVIAAGAGILALGGGAYFGLQAKSHLDDSNAAGHCQPDNRCDPVGTV